MKKQLRLRSVFFYLLMVFCLCVSILPVNAEETGEVLPDNGIPVVYINIDESQGTIEDMIASEDHSVYCYGTISIEVPEGFHYSDFPDSVCESISDLSMSIRGRGNSTWSEMKRNLSRSNWIKKLRYSAWVKTNTGL